MKIAALIFGILGALSALTLASYAFALGSLFVAIGGTHYGQLWQSLSVIISLAVYWARASFFLLLGLVGRY